MAFGDKRKRRNGPRKTSKASQEQGFTLIETSIALVVMMIVTLATAGLFAYAINYNSGANDRAMALSIAQKRMERLRRAPFTDASLSTASSTEYVTSNGRPYAVLTTICSTSTCGGSASLKVITIQVTPQGGTTWANTAATMVSERAAPTIGPYWSN